MNVFEAVKQSVTTRQAAERYGVRVGRNGMCVCPFHADKNQGCGQFLDLMSKDVRRKK